MSISSEWGLCFLPVKMDQPNRKVVLMMSFHRDHKSLFSLFRWMSLAVLPIMATVPARSADDAPRKSEIECIGSFGECITAFAVQGHIAYTAGGYVVRAIDIRDPQRPKVLGWVHMPQPITGLEARGPAVYVAMENGGGAWLVDASNPARLRRVGHLAGQNRSCELCLMGDFLYMKSSGKWGMPHYVVLRISDPLKPLIVDEWSSRYNENNAFITDGKRLYTVHKTDETNYSITLVIRDCSTKFPRTLLTRTFNLSDAPGKFDFDLKTGQIWLGETDPDDPALRAGKLDLTSEVWCFDHEGGPSELHYQFRGPWILAPFRNRDMTGEGYHLYHRAQLDKPLLSFKKNPERDRVPYNNPFLAASIHGNHLYVRNEEQCTVYPLRDPAHLTGYPLQTLWDCSDIRHATPELALARAEGGLDFIDTSNPSQWREFGPCLPHHPTASFKIVDRLAYAVGLRRLSVVDCHAPELPVQLGGCDLPSTVSVCAVENDTVYAGGDEGMFHAVDVSKPSQPALRGSGTLPKEPKAMAASGNRLFVADGEAGLQVIDTSNPAAMKTIGNYKMPEPCIDLASSGTQVYALTHKTLCVLDVYTSGAPTLKGSLIYRPKADDEAYEEYAYCAIKRLGTVLYLIRSTSDTGNRGTTVKIVDVTNPAAPRLTDVVLQAGEVFDEEENKSESAKTTPKPDPDSKTAGWLLGLPASSHSTDGTVWAMEFYDLSDPLHPVYVDDFYSRSACRQAILYKDILYKLDEEYISGAGSITILRRVGNSKGRGK